MRSLLFSLLTLTSALSLEDLYVSEAPSSPRPYILPHYENSHAVTIGSQLYRFSVTGPSSGYAFTLMNTNAPSSGSLGVLPHIHQTHYENFFNFKGRFQLWAQHGDDEQEGRLLTQGDFGSVPRNTTHTFQILDPDTEMVGIIVPGGFEDLFYALGTNYTSGTDTPYVPGSSNSSSSSATGPGSSTISHLQQYDVYAQLDFNPRRDLINGSAPSDSGWHTESNTLGEPTKPYFIANNYGPKYLNSQYGAYQIVQPLVTTTQAQDLTYTISTILLSRQQTSTTAPTWNATSGPVALEVLEGAVQVQIGEYPTARLETGDVAFVPVGMAYRYWNEAAYAKVLYVSSGEEGVDRKLIKGGRTWQDPVWPTS